MDIVTDIAILRQPTKHVTSRMVAEDKRWLVDIGQKLFDEMRERNGQGLAANQVGIPSSVCVMRRNNMFPLCLVNPKIVKTKGTIETNEGCLSLPGVVVRVKRPLKVTVVAKNQYWEDVKYGFKGIEARRACHEIDHLNGKLITDYEA